MLGCEACALFALVWFVQCSEWNPVCSGCALPPATLQPADGALVWTGLRSSEVCVLLVVPVQGGGWVSLCDGRVPGIAACSV